jgi:hypothetical protein
MFPLHMSKGRMSGVALCQIVQTIVSFFADSALSLFTRGLFLKTRKTTCFLHCLICTSDGARPLAGATTAVATFYDQVH